MKTTLRSAARARRIFTLVVLGWMGSRAAAAPSIVQQPPETMAARSGTAASIAVVASGTGTLRYQWRHLGVNLPGATGAMLSLPAPRMAEAGWYDVVVTDDTGSKLSRPTRLMVEPASGYPSAVEVDWTFRPEFENPGTVSVIAPLEDGRCYVGGNYVRFGGERRPNLLRLNIDGSVDETFTLDPAAGSGPVSAVVLEPDGRLIVIAGGTRLLRLNSDGTIDPSFNAGSGSDAAILAVIRQPDGKLILAGRFYSVSETARGRIARLNVDGSLDTAFAGGAGFSGDVQCLCLQSDGKIVAGGRFLTFNNASRSGIARLNADGTLDSTFNPGDGFGGYVSTLAMQQDGRFVVGGYFWSFNRTTQNNILRLNSDGTLDPTFAVGTGTNWNVYGVAVMPDGAVTAIGGFSAYNGTPCKSIVRLTALGAQDPSFDPGEGFDGEVGAIRLSASGGLWVGGAFSTYRGQPANAVARLSGNGELEHGGAGACRSWGTVSHALPVAEGRWVVAGSFRWVNGIPRNGIARLKADGSLDPAFDPGSGFSGAVNSLVAHTNGRILAAGAFTSFNGATCNRIARLNADGSLDTAFAIGAGFDNDVNVLAVQRDGKIVAGGDFWRLNKVVCGYIARLYPDGTRDPIFGASGGFVFDNEVESLALQVDGRLVVGGRFETCHGIARPHFTRLQPDGGLDTAFVGVTGFNGAVSLIEICADGSVLAGGTFSVFKNYWCDDLVRLTPTGEYDETFTPGTWFFYPSTMLLQADGRLLVGGPSGEGLQVVRLAANGAREAVLLETQGAAGGRHSAQYDDGGRLMVTGVVVSAGDEEQHGLVAYTRKRLSYSEWVAQFGLPLDQRDPLATPAGDGATNLMKFALGVPPLESATAHAPTATTIPVADEQTLAVGLVFTRNTDAQGIEYNLQISSDLLTWVDVDSVEEMLGANPDGSLLVRLRELVPTAAARGFARLKVELVSP